MLCPLNSPHPLLCPGGSKGPSSPDNQTQGSMAKEEDVKKFELKVTVNCCEGCRKKVLKALSIKGVLKTDIHPTLPRVTVLGNVDPRTLIKRLAKCGKTAELWPSEPKKQEKAENKSENFEKDVVDASNTSGKEDGRDRKLSDTPASGDCDEGEKKKKTTSKEVETSGSGKGNPTDEAFKNVNPACAVASMPTPVTALPQVNYVMNPGMVLGSGNAPTPTPYPHVCYTVRPYTIPATYHAAGAYAAHLPACCIRDHHYYDSPTFHRPLQLPSQIGDYFNDENTLGCHIM